MEIPAYIIKAVFSHYSRIASNATCDPADHKTRDCLRLARKDVEKLRKYLKQ